MIGFSISFSNARFAFEFALVGTLNDLRNLITNVSIVVSPCREYKMDSDEPKIDHKM